MSKQNCKRPSQDSVYRGSVKRVPKKRRTPKFHWEEGEHLPESHLLPDPIKQDKYALQPMYKDLGDLILTMAQEDEKMRFLSMILPVFRIRKKTQYKGHVFWIKDIQEMRFYAVKGREYAWKDYYKHAPGPFGFLHKHYAKYWKKTIVPRIRVIFDYPKFHGVRLATMTEKKVWWNHLDVKRKDQDIFSRWLRSQISEQVIQAIPWHTPARIWKRRKSFF